MKRFLCRLGFHWRVRTETQYRATDSSPRGELFVFEVCQDCGKKVEYLPRWRWWQLQKRPKVFKKKNSRSL